MGFETSLMRGEYNYIMPELPEVETIKLGLETRIVGKTLTNIQILNPKTFIGNPKTLRGSKVLNIDRKAKMLLVNLSGDLTLVFHLKMTGQLIWIGNRGQVTGDRIIGGHPTPDMRDQMPNQSTRVIFEFSDPSRQKADEASNSKLYFNDQRKFGWVKLIQSSKIKDQSEKILGKLGPEPLERGLTWQILRSNLLKHKSQPVKLAIMDQSVVSGIGNIYASEALFLAKIDPRRRVNTLSDQDVKNLFQGIQESLKLAIKYGGSTRAHFVDAEGKKGYYLDYANVYGKQGYKCKGCPGKVQKITLSGRGTYFCPSCQK